MRILAGAAAATVLAMTAGCGSTHAAPGSLAESRTGGVVPWADRPAPPYADPVPRTFAANARPCRAADLTASPGRSGAGLGHTVVQILFTNRSPGACLLTGYPSVAGISAGGTITPLNAGHGGYFGNPGPAANIATGQAAAVNVLGEDACQAAQNGQHLVYLKLRIGLPGGGSLTAPARFDAICGVWVSRFGVPADLPRQPPPSPLTVAISAAGTVHPGEDFTYRITLANPTATAYRLVPCPAYEEYVVPMTGGTLAPGGYVVKNYYLNCDTVHQIAAHGSVTYQMRLQLPPGLRAGVPAKFVWLMHGGAGPGTGAPLRITA